MRSENNIVSWTKAVKDELLAYFTKSQKCQLAEVYAIRQLAQQNLRHDEKTGLYIYEEPVNQAKNSFTEKRKTYNIKDETALTDIIENICRDQQSKRAFLRGAFLASGSFTDPNKSYQLEIITDNQYIADIIQGFMADFGINARVSGRRGKYVVYLKEGPSIVDMLNVIGAHKTLMEFENIRIIKEINGSVNRQVNCETANITKTVTAAQKQLEDIELIRSEYGFDNIDENLKDICLVRINNPDAALSELGDLMKPKLGKSGVNHRMRKIGILADEIRKKRNIRFQEKK